MTKSCFKHYLALAAIGLFAILFWIGVISWAVAAVTWNQQPGQYYRYDKTPINKLDASWHHALITDAESVNNSWPKQDGVFIQCKSTGGSNRYYPEGYDCNTGKPKVTVVNCNAFLCASEFGLVFDLTKNTVNQCPKVYVTKEMVAMIYEGKQFNIPSCR